MKSRWTAVTVRFFAKRYPKADLHLLEYVITSYLLSDVEKQEKSERENEDVIIFYKKVIKQ